MAQVIFRTIDNSHTDVAKNRVMYKTGDVVTVVEDSHLWGEGESKLVWTANGNDPALWPGGFFILRITGMLVADAMYLLEEAGDWVPEVGDIELDPETYVAGHYLNNANRKRRANFVDFVTLYNSLNSPTRNQLDADGEYTVTLGMVSQYLKIKG